MSITTYAELRAAIANHSGRQDFADGEVNADRTPEFVLLAEKRLDRVLRKLGGGELVETAALTTSAEAIDLPADFNAMRYLGINGSRVTELVYRTPAAMYAEYPDSGARQPRVYTLHGKGDLATNITRARFRPIPDSAYALIAYYFKRITTLVGGADGASNWMLTYNPDAYLYACLLECANYRQDAEDIQRYGQLLANAVNDIVEQDDDRRVGSSAPRAAPGVRMMRGM